jgi:chaperonin GroEL (HSP60 family)
MAISVRLQKKAKTVQGIESWPYKAVADAMEVIPRTLVQNAGGNAIRVLTELRVSKFSVLFLSRPPPASTCLVIGHLARVFIFQR